MKNSLTKIKNKLRKIKYKIIGLKKIRLGVSYNVFDGEELLESSIKTIRKHAFYINVVYQEVSNSGQSKNLKISQFLEDLKTKKMIDEYILYNPNLSLNRSKNERLKRLLGLKYAKKRKCTHFLSMDVDEFYKEDELEMSIQYIKYNNINCSAVHIIEYLKEPIYQLVNNYFGSVSEYYCYFVPFIIKIKKLYCQRRDKYFPCFVDGTRIFNGRDKFYLFPKHLICMHHMTTIRRNLKDKYHNSSYLDVNKNNEFLLNLNKKIKQFSFEENKIAPNYSMFGNFLVKKVDNIFNINIK